MERRHAARPVAVRAPAVVTLDEALARDATLAGAKAAALARALARGFPVLPGFVVTTEADPDGDAPAIREAWETLSRHGARPLVVRSSSTVEDAATASMAGAFESILDVRGWEAFRDAVSRVLASAARVDRPGRMAVLVQPFVPAALGGVLFGADPVTGSRDRIVVEAVAGGPDALVSGEVTASRAVLSRRGRLRSSSGGDGALDRRRRRELAAVARRAEVAFGGPQDVEWALDADGALWVLQSRPITATGDAIEATGPVLGPGPVGETFPDPLRPLEREIFVDPLREGILGALAAVGAVPRRRVEASPVLTLVGNRVAADLDLLGWRRVRRAPIAVLNPAPGFRRLVAAWHVGRIRRALPAVAARIVREVDERLARVPPLPELPDERLLAILARVPAELAAVHAHQILAGMLLPPRDGGGSATTVALPAVGAARARGERDADVVARCPAALALVPPRVGAVASLPDVPAVADADVPCACDLAALEPREALRLRARWLDELAARAATEIGRRLAARGRVEDAADVRELSVAELRAVVDGAPVPPDLPGRRRVADGPPLPATFRLTPTGHVVAQRPDGDDRGRGAGGGRGEGVARREEDGPSRRGDVLVVRVLAPSLAPRLPVLAGIVSETGSALSHLAIVAREQGVPTVVAVPGALDRFPPGARVLVDGTTGEVRRLDGPPGGEEGSP
jgi:pyruvate,water dikinase